MNGNMKWLGGVDRTQNCVVQSGAQRRPNLNEAKLKKEK